MDTLTRDVLLLDPMILMTEVELELEARRAVRETAPAGTAPRPVVAASPDRGRRDTSRAGGPPATHLPPAAAGRDYGA